MKISKKILSAALATSMIASMSAATTSAEIEDIEIEEEVAIETPAYGNYISVSSSTEKNGQTALNDKLAEVTLTVRNTLQIGDEYTYFNGDFSENVTNRIWYLDWNNDDKSISVQAAEDGTVMRYRKNYYNSRNTYQSYNNFYNPKFQTTSIEAAKNAAEAFLYRVLKGNEGYVFTDTGSGTLSPMSVNDYYFRVVLTVNGLETPFYMNITVNAKTLEVVNFNRNDNNDSYFGDYPSPSSNYEEKNAFASLSKKFDNTLKYYIVYDKDDTERKNPKAELQYKFYSTGDWFFDAKTGETVNRNDLFDDAFNNSVLKGEFGATTDSVEMEEAAPESANGGYKLTEVELESIEKMKDIIKGEDIAKMISEKYPEFGLDGFELISTSYSRNVETDEVKANLSFSKIVTKGEQIGMSEKEFKERKESKNIYYIRKNITADGKTGELINYNTSYPYVNEEYSNNKTYKTDSLKVAESFLTKHFAEEFGASALTNTYSNNIGTHTTYTFTNTVNGYTLDQNWLSVRVNNITGDIDTYSKAWVYGVEFESPEGIISAEEALKIYTTIYNAKLQYITVPVAIDVQKPEFAPYVNAGWNYVHSFKTAYKLNENAYAYGVKAKDGTLLKPEEFVNEGIVFTDIENCESKDKIEALAEYGITFGGTEFEPKTLLNQKDMLIYLLNSVGNRFSVLSYENAEESDLDYLYDQAVYYGFITSDERDPEKLIRKEDLAKAMILPSEYNAATTLSGLIKADYADGSEISEGYLPYIVIAETLGLIETDSENKIDPNGLMTREDLAKAVYAFMDR